MTGTDLIVGDILLDEEVESGGAKRSGDHLSAAHVTAEDKMAAIE
jgi:hypothetical protein